MGTNIDITKLHYSDPRFKLYNDLQSDVARFATYREARRQKDLATAPDEATRLKIEKQYANWLKTEKQGVFANAAAAAKWTRFAENADMYPNLQYRTARDKDVRPEHARLEGLILPINDPFWSTHYPPLGFGCRCYVTQTDKAVVRSENYLQTKAETGFDFNPGIEHKIFSNSAGYYKGWSHEEMKFLDEKSKSIAALIVKENVMQFMKNRPNKYKLGSEFIQISNRDVKDITREEHMEKALKNALLFDIQNVLNDAILKDEAPEGKRDKDGNIVVRPKYKHWWYYQVKGYDNMFLNIVMMKEGYKKLHSITDGILKK